MKNKLNELYTILLDDYKESKVGLLVKAIERDSEFYVPQFMYTLKVNKVESILQNEEKPAIFRKGFDKIGLIKKLYVREPYKDLVIIPCGASSHQEVRTILEYLFLEKDELADERQLELENMLSINQMEGRIMDCLPDSELNKGPIFLREVNGFGITTKIKFTDRQNYDLLSKDFDMNKLGYLRHLKVL